MKIYKKLSMIIVIILTTFTTLFAVEIQESTSQQEKDALIALYNSTNGANWTDNTNWNNGDPCVHSWYGVVCNPSGDITELSLGSNNLIGTISTDIGDLTNLRRFDLHNNHLAGTIPINIGNLTSLIDLYLYYNQLTGSIPSEISNLRSLRFFNVSNNQLAGSIPTGIGNLESLNSLVLQNNQLTGTIPSEIESLISLGVLNLNGNQLTGTIPLGIENLINLTYLKLNDNYLSGKIPSSIMDTNLANTDGLNLQTNCSLYTNNTTVQGFMEDKMSGTYEEFLATQGQCKTIIIAPVIMYLLN